MELYPSIPQLNWSFISTFKATQSHCYYNWHSWIIGFIFLCIKNSIFDLNLRQKLSEIWALIFKTKSGYANNWATLHWLLLAYSLSFLFTYKCLDRSYWFQSNTIIKIYIFPRPGTEPGTIHLKLQTSTPNIFDVPKPGPLLSFDKSNDEISLKKLFFLLQFLFFAQKNVFVYLKTIHFLGMNARNNVRAMRFSWIYPFIS